MATKTIDTDKYFEEYSKTARTAMAWVYPTEFRALLEKTIDLQVEAGKFIAKSATDTFSKMVPAAK
jgi:hypothetical protein